MQQEDVKLSASGDNRFEEPRTRVAQLQAGQLYEDARVLQFLLIINLDRFWASRALVIDELEHELHQLRTRGRIRQHDRERDGALRREREARPRPLERGYPAGSLGLFIARLSAVKVVFVMFALILRTRRFLVENTQSRSPELDAARASLRAGASHGAPQKPP